MWSNFANTFLYLELIYSYTLISSPLTTNVTVRITFIKFNLTDTIEIRPT